MEKENLETIKTLVEEFFSKMTAPALVSEPQVFFEEPKEESKEKKEVVSLSVKLEEPQVFIGQQGQTLFETQKLLRMILNKKLQQNFYFDLDINEYKKRKNEYLISLAVSSAEQAVSERSEKLLPPMPSYERKIVHEEISKRTDVFAESRGDGQDRRVVIIPR